MSDESINSDEIVDSELGDFEEGFDDDEDLQNEGDNSSFDDLNSEDIDGAGQDIRVDVEDADVEQERANSTYQATELWRKLMTLYSRDLIFMDKINRFPQKQMVTFHEGVLEKIKEGDLMLKLGLLGLIHDLTKLREIVTEQTGSSVIDAYRGLSKETIERSKMDKIQNSKIDTQKIFEKLENEVEERKPYWKQESDNWFVKTSITVDSNDSVNQITNI